MKRTAQGQQDKKQGFALLISITLVAFVVLLLVSLTTLIKIETEVAARHQQAELAKQNALLALSVAIGQVQEYAGPDQRITARADLEHGPEVNNARWIGVYGSSIPADYDRYPEEEQEMLTDPAYVNAKGSPAKLLTWLVSGNETAPFDPIAGTGPNGEIINPPASGDIPFDPTSNVTNLSTAGTVNALSNNITLDSRPAQLLVGPATVNSSISDGGVALDYVAAPLVDVTDESNGRYAWWVSDENLKARANLPLPTGLAEMRNALVSAPRTAIELMSRGTPEFPQSPLSASLIDEYDPTYPLQNIFSVHQLPFSGATPQDLEDPFKYRFHDVSVVSNSVLADAYTGGLKRDLSILLDESYIPQHGDPTADTETLFPISEFDDKNGAAYKSYAVPTWKHIRSFAQTRVKHTGGVAEPMEPRPPSYNKDGVADDVGVGPVLTYFSLGWRFGASGNDVNVHFYPLVVLWNPYTFPIAAHEYEVGMWPSYSSKVRFEVEKEDLERPADYFHYENWDLVKHFDFMRPLDGNSDHYIRFRVDAPQIPPGQSLIFTLQNSGDSYNEENVLEHGEPEPANFVSLKVGTMSSDQASRPYRVATYHHPTNYGTSVSNGGGGEMYTYLGEPFEGRVYAHQQNTHNPSFDPDRQWYQAHQRIGWDKITVDHKKYQKEAVEATVSLQQFTGSPLSSGIGEEPAFSFNMQALFSGYGNNDQLANQHLMPTRWIAQGNMRAARSGRTRRDKNYNVLFTATAGHGSYIWQKFVIGNNGDRTSAGLGHDWIDSGPVDVTLFELPYDNQPLLSLGQLQHANVSLIGAYPAYPVGNSLADFRLVPEQIVNSHNPGNLTDLSNEQKSYYDISWVLNKALWDRYYFSGVSVGGTDPDVLFNSRHVVAGTGNLQDPDRSAANLFLSGGFNINSTSEQAWRAVLGGLNQLAYDPEYPSGAATSSREAIFSRFYYPTAGPDEENMWQGYRTLSETEIARLARSIVEEIRKRGPFVSMGDFVNRRLVDNPTTDFDERLKGVIQAAIDAHTSATDYASNTEELSFWNDDALVTNPRTKADQQAIFDDGTPQYQWNNSRGSNLDAKFPFSARSAFGPKFLTQADVLSTIGSSLTARSDTFVIRTYGEMNDPLLHPGDPGFVTGRAWCEAVVQRVPAYVDSSEAPESRATSGGNLAFGRKFQIISFRWLSSSEI